MIQGWEHRVVTVAWERNPVKKGSPAITAEEFAALGRDGWEAVGFHPLMITGVAYTYILLKRPLAASSG